ncbi:IL17B protein, partial [Polypterus senegalus]
MTSHIFQSVGMMIVSQMKAKIACNARRTALHPEWRSSLQIPQIPAAFPTLSWFTTCAISVRLCGSQLIGGSASGIVDPEMSSVLAGGSALNSCSNQPAQQVTTAAPSVKLLLLLSFCLSIDPLVNNKRRKTDNNEKKKARGIESVTTNNRPADPVNSVTTLGKGERVLEEDFERSIDDMVQQLRNNSELSGNKCEISLRIWVSNRRSLSPWSYSRVIMKQNSLQQQQAQDRKQSPMWISFILGHLRIKPFQKSLDDECYTTSASGFMARTSTHLKAHKDKVEAGESTD